MTSPAPSKTMREFVHRAVQEFGLTAAAFYTGQPKKLSGPGRRARRRATTISRAAEMEAVGSITTAFWRWRRCAWEGRWEAWP